jgi:hypothetical protein
MSDAQFDLTKLLPLLADKPLHDPEHLTRELLLTHLLEFVRAETLDIWQLDTWRAMARELADLLPNPYTRAHEIPQLARLHRTPLNALSSENRRIVLETSLRYLGFNERTGPAILLADGWDKLRQALDKRCFVAPPVAAPAVSEPNKPTGPCPPSAWARRAICDQLVSLLAGAVFWSSHFSELDEALRDVRCRMGMLIHDARRSQDNAGILALSGVGFDEMSPDVRAGLPFAIFRTLGLDDITGPEILGDEWPRIRAHYIAVADGQRPLGKRRLLARLLAWLPLTQSLPNADQQ